MKYWKVQLTRGHMGNGNNNGLITFYEQGNNLIEAWDKARRHPGVKHTSLANLKGEEVSYSEYKLGIEENAYARCGAKMGYLNAKHRHGRRG